MKCKFHPEREAEVFCTSCNAPLCPTCAEEIRSGEIYCFQCAMMQSVSDVGTSVKEKRGKAEEKKQKRKRQWGPFQYFVGISSVLILVMWGVILFGGSKPPARTMDFAKQDRILLFMVDGALKRYALYESNRYPERLTDLFPKYLSMRDEEAIHLKKVEYARDPHVGYRLSLVNTKPGEMKIILTSKGIEYSAPAGGGV